MIKKKALNKSWFQKLNEDLTGLRTTILNYIAMVIVGIANYLLDYLNINQSIISDDTVIGAAGVATLTGAYQVLKKVRE